MLLKNLNLKLAIIGTTALSMLSLVAPEIGQAATININVGLPHDSMYESRFNIRTGTKDSNSDPNLGRYNRGIGNYGLYKPPSISPVSNSRYSLLDLTVKKFGNLNTIPDDLAYSFIAQGYQISTAATIYEYSFTVPNSQNILLDQTEPSPFGTDGSIKWYVPSQFTYTKSGSSFSIDLADGKTQLLNSLKGFDTIFNNARSMGGSKITFPTNSTTSLLSRQAIQANSISPAAIPESNSSPGLIVLGLIGSYLIIKRKTTVELKRLD